MNCYYYKIINETSNPILNNVDVVIILTMENSKRFKEDPFILNLAKKTIIQYNKGYKNCKKPNFIHSTVEDINYSYYVAFEYLKEYNNVIILEDDAIIINKDLNIYRKIDNFVITEKFDIFSFGSTGLLLQYNSDFYKYYGPYFAAAQAIIYSKNTRDKLTKMFIENNFSNMTDLYYIQQLENKFTYKEPLIVQLFTETENRKNWQPNFLIPLAVILIKLLQLDLFPDSWYILYFINKNIIFILLIILIIIIILFNK